MGVVTETGQISITTELAEAIAFLDISKVAGLLAESGEYWIKNENNEIVRTNKADFLKWLSDCFCKFIFTRKSRTRLDYNILHCLHCRTGNPIIIFEDGKFPITRNPGQKEAGGLVIQLGDNKVTGITLCYLILKTEDPFLYERKCIRPDY